MSNIDKQALRKAALAATGGKWVFSRSGANSNVQAPIELQKGGRALVVLCKLNNAGWSGQIQTENNAKFIAAANPATVLALLDELEARDRRIEEEIGRANREHHRGFMMACGHLKEHANVHYADAAEMEMAALRQRIAELEARTLSIILPDPSSKAFWGGSGKNETFYPSTYKIWVKESIERAGAIAQIAVKVV